VSRGFSSSKCLCWSTTRSRRRILPGAMETPFNIMTKAFRSIDSAIGNTPLRGDPSAQPQQDGPYLRQNSEYFNPGGSIKDRVAPLDDRPGGEARRAHERTR